MGSTGYTAGCFADATPLARPDALQLAAADRLPCGCAALVFEGVGWFDVAMAVFAGRHNFLAARFVPYSERFAAMSPEEVKIMLLDRLKPIRKTAQASTNHGS